MRAEAVSWDDWSAVNQPPIVEDDKWHVALAPGEVKVVSLEQLDDLFRLSIVDAETKVWQNGMSEWQPLRVIADLDDVPVAEPKRTYPKPPSPRSAPPPPRPQSLAPAPAFAEPFGLAATQPAFVTPIAIQPIASVRPLTVSTRAPAPRRGGDFGRLLIALSLVAGVGVSLYRNGVLHDVAQSTHRESLFARLESALGGPSFGTLRAVEQGSAARLGEPLTSDLSASLPTDAQGVQPESSGPSPAAQPPAQTPAAATPVVALESLKPENAAKPTPLVAVAASPQLTPSIKPSMQPNLQAEPQVKTAPSKPTVAEKPAAPSKPASEMTERERLNAAIGQAMLSTPPKGTSKSKASEYDPLNPKL
jgi:GYF domain 2